MSRVAEIKRTTGLIFGAGMGADFTITFPASTLVGTENVLLRLYDRFSGALVFEVSTNGTSGVPTIAGQVITSGIDESTTGDNSGSPTYASLSAGTEDVVYDFYLDVIPSGADPSYRFQGQWTILKKGGLSDKAVSQEFTVTLDTGITATFSAASTTIGAGTVTTAMLASPTGSDTNVVTGTAGTSGNTGQWNADGDLIDGKALPSGDIVGTTDAQTLTNKTVDLDSNTVTGTIAEFQTAVQDATLRTAGTTDAFGVAGGIFFDPPSDAADRTATINNVPCIAFDGTTSEKTRLRIAMPKAWNTATTIQVRLATVSDHTGTGTRIFDVRCAYVSDGVDLASITFGSDVSVTDTGQSSATKMLEGPTSGAITPSGTPSAGTGWLIFEIQRDVADTTNEDVGIADFKLHFTTNAANDA